MSSTILAILCGLIGFVTIELLCQPFEVFGWWPSLLRKWVFESQSIVDYEEMKWWQVAIIKPFSGCGKCLAGWLGLVTYLVSFDFHLFTFAAFVCGAIFTAWVLTEFKNRIEQ